MVSVTFGVSDSSWETVHDPSAMTTFHTEEPDGEVMSHRMTAFVDPALSGRNRAGIRLKMVDSRVSRCGPSTTPSSCSFGADFTSAKNWAGSRSAYAARSKSVTCQPPD